MKFLIRFILLISCATTLPVFADHHEKGEMKETPTAARAMILEIDAQVTAIDVETRQVSLTGPLGETVTLTAGPDVVRFNELAIGDTVTATYLTSIAAELREPTEEEKMAPFVEITDKVRSESYELPGGAVARIIRAVCTIEGMNRITRTVTILDSRNRIHIIGDVQPESFTLISLGQKVIITYTEAVALTLEKTIEKTM
jgi:hypothetical protein